MNNRILGTILIAGTVIVMLDGLRTAGADPDAPLDAISNLVLTIWSLSGVCGITGLIRSGALGQSPVARALGFLPMLGFFLLFLMGILELAGVLVPETAQWSAMATLGWVSLLAGMLVVGILTIAAKNWQGWRRFVPLLTALGAPIALAIGSATNWSVTYTGILAYAMYILLGYVIASAEPAPAVAQNALV
jgi:hypothetical protein